jgi:3-deoxy-manno-octulosonate cytidylyltransferase (CMP-KDO synthetase)
MDRQGYALYFSRSLIPGGPGAKFNPALTYFKHIGLYGYRREFLLKYGKLAPTPLQLAEDLEQLKVLEHGYKIKTAIVESTSISVDHPEDIKKVESLLCKQSTYLSPAAFVPL